MAYLKFNKAELVNLEYSLKREIIAANKSGAYFNTSIIACNTRKYHGLLVVPSDAQATRKAVLLSSLDDSIVLNGKQFNLGIHCYGDVYEPKGHKYIVDFNGDAAPTITYKVGPIIISKSFVISETEDKTYIKYRLESAPGKITLLLKPFLAFRDTHCLTQENPVADSSYEAVSNGVRYHMYEGLPSLYLQTSLKPSYHHQPYWYKGVTYSNEYRRGFDCREDLLVPGTLSVDLKEGGEVYVCASTKAQSPAGFRGEYGRVEKGLTNIYSHKDVLLKNARRLKVFKGGKKNICAGYSWLESGLLRESLLSLPGLTIYADGNRKEFEEILDNLIAAEGDRLLKRTTQIEAPFLITEVLQEYIAFGASEKDVWKKYGDILKAIVESYAGRENVVLSPNGLLWCQRDRTALSWMNSYINGCPVNERAGFQVETNALWYNALCFALEMDAKYASRGSGRKKDNSFADRFAPIRDLVKENFGKTFIWQSRRGFYSLADYVDNAGQHRECRPNMLWAVYIPYPLVEEYVSADVLGAINNELVTRRGIRTLSPRDPAYKGSYDGSQIERDLAFYNGCTFAYLLGLYEDICFRLLGDSFCGKAKWLTEGFFEDANLHGVGAFSEIYDGDPPHEPHGAIASATATAALMRCIYLMDKHSVKEDRK